MDLWDGFGVGWDGVGLGGMLGGVLVLKPENHYFVNIDPLKGKLSSQREGFATSWLHCRGVMTGTGFLGLDLMSFHLCDLRRVPKVLCWC